MMWFPIILGKSTEWINSVVYSIQYDTSEWRSVVEKEQQQYCFEDHSHKGLFSPKFGGPPVHESQRANLSRWFADWWRYWSCFQTRRWKRHQVLTPRFLSETWFKYASPNNHAKVLGKSYFKKFKVSSRSRVISILLYSYLCKSDYVWNPTTHSPSKSQGKLDWTYISLQTDFWPKTKFNDSMRSFK